MRLKLKTTIGKPALRAIAFFAATHSSIDLAAFNAVENHFCAVCSVQVFVSPVVIKPQAENKRKTTRDIKKKKEIYTKTDHHRRRELRLKGF